MSISQRINRKGRLPKSKSLATLCSHKLHDPCGFECRIAKFVGVNEFQGCSECGTKIAEDKSFCDSCLDEMLGIFARYTVRSVSIMLGWRVVQCKDCYNTFVQENPNKVLCSECIWEQAGVDEFTLEPTRRLSDYILSTVEK